jgi:hypothetical protein
MKNGVEYVRIDKVETRVKLGKVNITLRELFKEKSLNDIGQTIINQNIDQFLPDIEIKIQQSLEKTALKASSQIFERIPFNQLLP